MSHLAKLQHTFQNYVLKPGTISNSATGWVSASGRVDPETQVSVYSYAYHARLREVLANDYPAILMAIGEHYFNQLANDYIKAYPSHYFSLRDFGSHLPGFIADLIKKNESLYASWHEMPWCYELAIFEWTLGQVFDAADDKIFTQQDMSTIPAESWPDLKFTLHPSVHRLDFNWNIPEIWQALTDEEPTEITAQHATTSPWLLWREQLITRFRSIQIDEQLALDKIYQGANFNDVCEALSTMIDEDNVPLHAATLLKGWITQGLISEVYLD